MSGSAARTPQGVDHVLKDVRKLTVAIQRTREDPKRGPEVKERIVFHLKKAIDLMLATIRYPRSRS